MAQCQAEGNEVIDMVNMCCVSFLIHHWDKWDYGLNGLIILTW
jgi:hypothetical protein